MFTRFLIPHRLVLALLGIPLVACGGRFTPRRPLTIEVAEVDRPFAPTACELPLRSAPTGGTPEPATQGALSLQDRRGDDRLGVSGYLASAWSLDGAEVFTATATGVQVWSAETGALSRWVAFPEVLKRPSSLALSPDGARLVVQGTTPDDDARAWVSPTDVLELRALANPSTEPAFFTDSELIAGGQRWTIDTFEASVDALVDIERRMLPDGRRVLTFVSQADDAYLPEIRDARTGEVEHRFDAVRLPQAVAVSGDGSRVAVLADALTVFDATSFEPIAHFEVGEAAMVALSHDGSMAVVEGLICLTLIRSESGTSDCQNPTMAVWDVDQAERRWESSLHAGRQWIFGPSDTVLTGPRSRLVSELLRVEDGSEIAIRDSIPSISPDGRRALVRSNVGTEIVAIEASATTWSTQPAFELRALSDDGSVAITIDGDLHLRLESDGCVDLGDVREAGQPLHLSQDGALLITLASDHERQLLRALDARTGALSWSIELTGEGGTGARVLASDSTVYAQGNDHDDVLRFDVRSGERMESGAAPRRSYEDVSGQRGLVHEVRDVRGERVSHLATSGSGRGSIFVNPETLASASWLSIWNLDDPDAVTDLRVAGVVTMTRLSPDGSLVGVGRTDGGVGWYGLDSAEWVDGASPHGGGVTDIRMSEGLVASAAKDGSIRVHDVVNGRLLGSAQLWNDHAIQIAWASASELVAETHGGMRVRFSITR